QAEKGIRTYRETGAQTYAHPISNKNKHTQTNSNTHQHNTPTQHSTQQHTHRTPQNNTDTHTHTHTHTHRLQSLSGRFFRPPQLEVDLSPPAFALKARMIRILKTDFHPFNSLHSYLWAFL